MNERTQNRFGLNQREIINTCIAASKWFKDYLFTGIGATRTFAEYSRAYKMLYENDQDGNYDHMSPWLNGLRSEVLLAYHAFPQGNPIPRIPNPEMNLNLYGQVLAVLGDVNAASVPLSRDGKKLSEAFLRMSHLGVRLGDGEEFTTLYCCVSKIRERFSMTVPGDRKETLLRPMDDRDNPHSLN